MNVQSEIPIFNKIQAREGSLIKNLFPRNEGAKDEVKDKGTILGRQTSRRIKIATRESAS
jgi:hypothetical protein